MTTTLPSSNEPAKLSKEELIQLKFFSLLNYRQIRTPFAFIDESGALSRKDDPFFGIGMFKVHRPSLLYRELRRIRSRYNFYEEIKFNKLSFVTLKIAREFLKVATQNRGSNFSAIIIPKTDPSFDLDKYFNGDIFQLYKKFLVELIKKNISEVEVLTVLSDDYFTPTDSLFDNGEGESFEGGVRAIVNDHFKRLALTGVCQISSKWNDCLQLVDILIGCSVFDAKIAKGYINENTLSKTQSIKMDLLNFVKEALGIKKNVRLSSLKHYESKDKRFRVKLFVPKTKETDGSSSIEATPAVPKDILPNDRK
ncbi:MAG: DUF3800 domain-containing protein [Candidatus Peribacteraceae bacterium]|nr:DUF3800 domain-containing protein [Candidatus Peribacteraceae bacterium]